MRNFVLIAAVPAALLCEALIQVLGTAIGLPVFYVIAITVVVIRQSFFAEPRAEKTETDLSGAEVPAK